MENFTTTRVMGKGKNLFEFTFSKLLSFSNVLFVSSLCRNLVSCILLNKVGLKTVIGDDKVVISCSGVFVASETLNGNASTSACIAESVDLWHGT